VNNEQPGSTAPASATKPAPVLGCRVCGSQEVAQTLEVREMMFGMRDRFIYTLCADCGSLSQQVSEYDMVRYYPSDYYSFSETASISPRQGLALKMARFVPAGLLAWSYRLTGSYNVGLYLRLSSELRDWLRAPVCSKLRVLDVGCGSGPYVRLLALAGFQAEGLDPFYSGPNPAECVIHRCELQTLQKEYEVILFNNSFEHMAAPAEVLHHAFARLCPGGVCVLTLPKLPSAAFDQYGADWYSIDAPRHFFVPSVDGLTRLAIRAGFADVSVQHRENAESFLWSEGYRRDVPRTTNRLSGVVGEDQIQSLKRQAAEAVRQEKSCQATFILRKPGRLPGG
jgi:SAM-dependent methyltransferase